MIRPLTNDGWGFPSNCFVCATANESGLRVPFQHDDEEDVVFADFTFDERFSGAPTYVHGGLTLALLDEAVAWAAIAVGGKFAVTHVTTTTFDRPVRVGVPYRVVAAVVDQTTERIIADGRVLDGGGKLRASCRAELVILGPAQAHDAIGVEVSGDDTRFLR